MDYEGKVDEDCCFIRKYALWKLCEDDCWTVWSLRINFQI